LVVSLTLLAGVAAARLVLAASLVHRPDGGLRAEGTGGGVRPAVTARDEQPGGASGGAGGWPAGADPLAAEAIALLTAHGRTIATAESLTGGMLAAALTSIPGASAVFRGGVVAYATDLKASLLGVPAGLLDRYGAVHADVAAAMAEGACGQLAASVGAATTGVAGPDPADGQPVGTVHIAVRCGHRTARRALALSGNRDQIRMATVWQTLGLIVGILREETP
jgi:nicotinamide-nucleotide amidase